MRSTKDLKFLSKTKLQEELDDEDWTVTDPVFATKKTTEPGNGCAV